MEKLPETPPPPPSAKNSPSAPRGKVTPGVTFTKTGEFWEKQNPAVRSNKSITEEKFSYIHTAPSEVKCCCFFTSLSQLKFENI
jgi:hypothetical protein